MTTYWPALSGCGSWTGDRALQPWTSADGDWLLCYNGEIFNHRELHAELTRLGRRFRTESDTEVVLEAFLQWGEDAVNHLRGEFAFAIVERATGSVYLARDPLGVKPLYWARRNGCLHIASEIKALVSVGAQVNDVDPGHHGWADPENGPDLVAYVDLMRLGEDQARSTIRTRRRNWSGWRFRTASGCGSTPT